LRTVSTVSSAPRVPTCLIAATNSVRTMVCTLAKMVVKKSHVAVKASSSSSSSSPAKVAAAVHVAAPLPLDSAASLAGRLAADPLVFLRSRRRQQPSQQQAVQQQHQQKTAAAVLKTVKELYDAAKAAAANKATDDGSGEDKLAYGDLAELLVDGFESEQIWEELQLRHMPLLTYLAKAVADLEVQAKSALEADEHAEEEGDNDDEGTEEQGLDEDDDEMDDGEEEEEEDVEDEEHEDEDGGQLPENEEEEEKPKKASKKRARDPSKSR